MSKSLIIKSVQQIADIRTAGNYLNELLILIAQQAHVGVSLIELEQRAEQFLKFHNLLGSFKGYHGYPANLCLSINDCVVHGIPDHTKLKKGDLLKIDAGVTYHQAIADAAVSIIIGGNETNPDATHLIQTTKKALDVGLEEIQIGTPLIFYSSAVYETVLHGHCSILRNLTGHGVGTAVHELPTIYNRAHPSMEQLKRAPNRVVALEPITAQRSTEFVEKPGNNRNLYTKGGDLGAQWEYTITITPQGVEILAGITDPQMLL